MSSHSSSLPSRRRRGACRSACGIAPIPQVVVPGVWLIPGAVQPDRQPDGNSVIFAAPDGLVVVDTGRHPWHREAILALARAQDAAIVAIVTRTGTWIT